MFEGDPYPNFEQNKGISTFFFDSGKKRGDL